MTNIKDVSFLAGVSVASESRVLKTNCSVAEPTRVRVIAAGRALNYSIDQRARAIRLQTSVPLG